MNRAFRSLDAAARILNGDRRKRRRRGSSVRETILICPCLRPYAPPPAFPLHAWKARAPLARFTGISLSCTAKEIHVRSARYRDVIKYRDTATVFARRALAAEPAFQAIVSQWQPARSPESLRPRVLTAALRLSIPPADPERDVRPRLVKALKTRQALYWRG